MATPHVEIAIKIFGIFGLFGLKKHNLTIIKQGDEKSADRIKRYNDYR